MNTFEVERALIRAERAIPLLRKHVEELSQDPTPNHRGQVRATLDRIETQLGRLWNQVVRS